MDRHEIDYSQITKPPYKQCQHCHEVNETVTKGAGGDVSCEDCRRAAMEAWRIQNGYPMR